MALQKLTLKPGVNRERPDYSNEGTWYECDKVRFRQGLPEKIGGWVRISTNTFLGVCRALYDWAVLAGNAYLGVGTNLKYYVGLGGVYYDVTPIRTTYNLTNPFTTIAGSAVVTVADVTGGFTDGDFVTYSGASAVGGLTLNGEYQITVVGASVVAYTITAATLAATSATGGGTVTAAYQINVGAEISLPLVGFGAAPWGFGPWGSGAGNTVIRLWSQSAFGEDLIFNARGGGIYYWDVSAGVTARAVELGTMVGASNTPTVANILLVSDVSRFVFAFGVNELGSAIQDQLLVRWSEQESAVDWTPSATNQAGGIRLSRGTKIVAAIQARQEILVWTNASLYSLQYVGAPVVWGTEIVGNNISIMSQNAVSFANGVSYWMGIDKFYHFDGRTQQLRCDIKRHIFSDMNTLQIDQIFSGSVEAFNEVWWFYCSTSSNTIDRYAVYNYVDDIWYYGSLARTAWLDSGLRSYPLGATYSNNLVDHELGSDNKETDTVTAIASHITSAQFDIDEGDRFSFISRVLPDMTFTGSSADSPSATFTFTPFENSGAGYTTPASAGGNNSGAVTRSAVVPVEAFTQQIDLRVRGRQIAFEVSSSAEGVTWQLGSPRIDVQQDGRR